MTDADLETPETVSALPDSRSRVSAVVYWAGTLAVTALYLYALIAAIGNLIGMAGVAESLGTALTPVGWLWLIVGVALPLLAFVLSFLIGHGRGPALRLLIVTAGLCVVAVLQLDIMHMIPRSSFFV